MFNYATKYNCMYILSHISGSLESHHFKKTLSITYLLFVYSFHNGIDVANVHDVLLQHILLQIQPIGNLNKFKHKSTATRQKKNK